MTDASQPPRPVDTGWIETAAAPYPVDLFWLAPQAPPVPRRPGRAAMVAIAVCASVAILGAPLGLLWAALAPSVPLQVVDGGVFPISAEPEEFVAADGWFALLGLGFGALAALAAWLVFRRWRGPLALLAVTVGAAGAGLVAWRLGREIGLAEYHRLLDSAPAGTVIGKPADLRALGSVLVPALGAAVVYTLLAGWSRFESLRPDLEPDRMVPGDVFADPPVSWGSTATPVPPAAPVPPEPGEAAPPRG